MSAVLNGQKSFLTEDEAENYKAIDHTAELFAAFDQYIDARGTSGGLFSVVGNDGCGKSSFINRCFVRLRTKLQTFNPAPGHTIYLPFEADESAGKDDTLADLNGLLVRELSRRVKDIDIAFSKAATQAAARRELEAVLRDKQIVVVLCVYELPGHLGTALVERYAVPGVFLFLEHSDLGVVPKLEAAAEERRFASHRLAIDSTTEADLRLVLSGIGARLAHGTVQVDDDVVSQYIVTANEGRSATKPSLREAIAFFDRLIEHAQREKVGRVNIEFFDRHCRSRAVSHP